MIGLNNGSQSLWISKITSEETRKPLGTTTVDLSVNGNPLIGGTAYESPYIWVVDCLLTEAERRILGAIAGRFENRRRSLPRLDPSVWLYDLSLELQEPSPKTRPHVPGSQVITVGGDVSYYPVFRVWFTQLPTYKANGRLWAANFALQEAQKVTL